MTSFLFDTLVWTGVLIAFVLLIRRPVARWLGAPAAYALWTLPVVRLLLPPIVLPAWLAPATVAAPEVTLPAQRSAVESFAAVEGVLPAHRPSTFEALAAIDWATPLLALWLFGASLFLVRRYALYFTMRRELLAGARPVGEAGRVRLVETPATDGPVAFGVIDKVVALPRGFMASNDRAARDLALAHELAHHRGHDLLSNMLVQPLFALHWFNPLAALGWRALRRDQEAACDARVMARQPREQRAAYAAVIAGFATQSKCAPRLALAAPMACPVLGDRSIVQRLRSLAMNDVSSRQRWSARLLIGGAALALPLTGSISYAQDEVPSMPAVPEVRAVDAVPPVPPAPPAAPTTVVTRDGKTRVIRIERTIDGEGHGDGRKRIEKRIILRNGQEMSAEDRAEFERDMAEHGRDMAEVDKEMAEIQSELAQEQAEIHRTLRVDQAQIQREVRMAMAEARRASPQVRVQCREGQREVTETVKTPDGETMFVCRAVAMAEARRGLAQARAEISRTRDLSAKERAEALRSLDVAERAMRAESRAD